MFEIHLCLHRAAGADTSALDFDALAFSRFRHTKSQLFTTGIISGTHPADTSVLSSCPVHITLLICLIIELSFNEQYRFDIPR
jgi:hypothetical protein